MQTLLIGFFFSACWSYKRNWFQFLPITRIPRIESKYLCIFTEYHSLALSRPAWCLLLLFSPATSSYPWPWSLCGRQCWQRTPTPPPGSQPSNHPSLHSPLGSSIGKLKSDPHKFCQQTNPETTLDAGNLWMKDIRILAKGRASD